MTDHLSNNADIIDSRDVIDRIAELADRADAERDGNDGYEPLDDDERAELTALQALAEEAEGYAADWQYGEALIRDSYFEDYARELAEDIGAISGEEQWPLSYIDWERAADALRMDYTAVDFDGVTYWVR